MSLIRSWRTGRCSLWVDGHKQHIVFGVKKGKINIGKNTGDKRCRFIIKDGLGLRLGVVGIVVVGFIVVGAVGRYGEAS